jgi:DNA-binding transcriptional LysR family regulator
MRFELNHLKYFYHVVTESGFAKAAKSLRVQPPVVSRSIKLLEEQLGVVLIERQKKFIRLTHEGEAVFSLCRDAFVTLDRIDDAAVDLNRKMSGSLRIACSDIVATEYLAPAISHLTRSYPEIYPILHCSTATTAFDLITSGRLDFGIFFHVPDAPSQIVVQRIHRVPFTLVIAKSHFKDQETRTSFIGSREVDDDSNAKFPTLQKWKAFEPDCKIRYSSNNLAVHKEWVKSGRGISVLPTSLVSSELKRNSFVDLMPKESLVFDLKLVTRKNGVQPKAATPLLSELAKVVG